MSDPISTAVDLLNDVLERDPKAITKLINMRIDCNERLANHPTVQVHKFDNVYRIGALGLLNGVLGGGPSGDIGARGKINLNTGEFIHINKFVDLRLDRLDVLA